MGNLSTDDFLEHHGVLGMKWGHHKAEGGSSGGSGGSGRTKPTNDEIKQARLRQQARYNQQVRLYSEGVTAKSEKGRQKAYDEINRIGQESLADKKIAKRATTGEKVYAGVLIALSAGAAASLLVPARRL